MISLFFLIFFPTSTWFSYTFWIFRIFDFSRFSRIPHNFRISRISEHFTPSPRQLLRKYFPKNHSTTQLEFSEEIQNNDFSNYFPKNHSTTQLEFSDGSKKKIFLKIFSKKTEYTSTLRHRHLTVKTNPYSTLLSDSRLARSCSKVAQWLPTAPLPPTHEV